MCMYSTISPKLVDMVIDDSMLTHEVWKRLQDIFHDNKDTKTFQLGIQIRSMNIGNLSVTEYFQAINSKADRLSNFGSTTNCPKALHRQLKRRGKNYPTLKLEAVASQDLWIWHAYFGVLEENNDFNVLYGSSLYDDILVDKALEAPFVVKFAAKLKALRMIRSYMRKKMRKQVGSFTGITKHQVHEFVDDKKIAQRLCDPRVVVCIQGVSSMTKLNVLVQWVCSQDMFRGILVERRGTVLIYYDIPSLVIEAMHASVVKGLIDGGVNVFEQQESEGKWSTSPPAENGAGPSSITAGATSTTDQAQISNGHIKWACHSAEGQMVIICMHPDNILYNVQFFFVNTRGCVEQNTGTGHRHPKGKVLLNGGKDDKVMLAYAYGLEASQEPVTKYRVLGPIISGGSLRSIKSRNS
ncbi:WRKY family transcription factor [Tanacetum coccineum]